MRKGMLLILGLALLISNGCATLGVEDNRAGSAYLRKSQLKEAESEFKKAIEADSNNPDFHNNLGVTYFRQGRIQEAQKEYKKAIELDANISIFHSNLGELYHEQGRLEDALKEMKMALEITPRKGELQNFQKFIEISYDSGSVEEGIRYIENLIRTTKPEGVEDINKFFLTNQAIIWGRILQGKYDEAINRSTEMIEILGKTKTEKGGYVIPFVIPIPPFFVGGFTRVPKTQININSIYGDMYNIRGLAYFRLGQYQKASQDFMESIYKNPNSLGNLNLGRIFLEQENFREASFYFRKILETNPRSVLGRIYNAIALKKMGEDSAADVEFNRGISNSESINTNLKSQYEVLESLAFSKQVWERWDEAIRDYKKVIQHSPNSGWAYKKMAEVHKAKNEKEQALEALRKALELMPGNEGVLKLARDLEK